MPDPDLTPSEEQLRRLLADARHDEPVPDDVVDRLDRVLADLRDEPRRTPAAVDAAPIDLAARRRRRIARNVLVAAAAVVVLGVGISRIDLSGQDAGGSADSGSASAPESAARDDESRPLVLSSEDFDRQVRRLGLNPPLASLGDVPEEAPSDRDLGELAARGWCHDPAWGGGDGGDDIVRVRYDGERGVLVLREPVGGTRVVDLYLCGDSDPTRSTTVPVG